MQNCRVVSELSIYIYGRKFHLDLKKYLPHFCFRKYHHIFFAETIFTIFMSKEGRSVIKGRDSMSAAGLGMVNNFWATFDEKGSIFTRKRQNVG